MSRWRRARRWAGVLTLSGVGLIAASLASLLVTEPGLRLVWRVVESRLPEELSIARVSGSVRGPVGIEGFVYETDALRVTAARATLAWDLPALLRRRLEITELTIDDVTVVLADTAPGEETAAPRTLPTLALPLPLRLDRGVAQAIDVRGIAPDGSVLRVDSLTVSGASFQSEVEFEELLLEAPEGRVRVAGRVLTRDLYPFTLRVEASVQPPEPVPYVDAWTELSGDLDAVTVSAASRLPLTATLSGRVESPLDDPRLDLVIEAEETAFRTLVPDAPEGSGGGRFVLRGVVDSLRVTGTARGSTPSTGVVDLDLDLERRPDRVLVQRLLAALGRARIDANGTVVLNADAPVLDVTASWTEVRWPLDGAATVRSASGSALLRGTTDRFRVRADASVETGALGETRPEPLVGRVTLSGAGTRSDFDFDSLRFDAPEGTVRARGHVAWAPRIAWDLEVHADDVRPGPFLSDSSLADARVAVVGRTSGTFVPTELSAEVTFDTVRGVVRAMPLEGRVQGGIRLPLAPSGPVLHDGDLRLDRLALVWNETQVEAAGAIGATVDLTLDAEVPDIGVLSPGGAGRAAARLRATGPRADPNVDLTLEAFALNFGASGDETEDGAPLLDTLLLRVTGTPAGHRADARLVRGQIGADVGADGTFTFADTTWTGALGSLTIVETTMGTWTLRDAAPVRVSPSAASLDSACLLQEPALSCYAASWTAAGALSGSAEITGLTGERLAALLPEGWSMTSGISARMSANVEPDGTLRADGAIDFEEGVVRYPTVSDVHTLRYAPSSIVAVVDSAGARLHFGTTMDDESGTEVVSIQGAFALPGYRNVNDSLPTEPLEGSMRAVLEDFGPVYAVFPDIGEITGEAGADLAVAGTVERPSVTGEAFMRGGSADVLPLGIALRDINLTARGRGGQGLDVEGSLRSDTGVLTVAGHVPVAPTTENPATLRVEGTRVQALGLPQASAWVSPDLRILGSADSVRVDGSVTIPVATIELTEIPTTAIRPSRDIVFVDDTTEAVAGALGALRFQVRLVIGDSVTFRGLGFSARPEGSILASQGAGGTVVGTGEVSLTDGRYFAFGQELVIERGRILFGGGPVDNPGLDVRASRTASDGVVAGLLVRGTLDEPIVTTFSNPAMSESEALSYIVRGRPLEQSGEDRSQIGAAATALGLQRGNQIAGQLGRSLGLDEMRVEAGSTLEEASLVAGTYISPKLYVSYGVGLFEPVSIFRLRYFLSRRWSLRAETGAADSADLLFRIERGR